MVKKLYIILGNLALIFFVISCAYAKTNVSNLDKDGNGFIVKSRTTDGVVITDIDSFTSYNFGEGYSITDEYSETSKGSKGWVIHRKIKTEPITSDSMQSAFTTAKAYPVSGHVRQNILSNGGHTIRINNLTDRTQSYRVEYTLQGAVGRQFYAYTVHVQSQKSFTDIGNSYINEFHTSSGFYSICANTVVTGESKNSSVGCSIVTVNN